MVQGIKKMEVLILEAWGRETDSAHVAGETPGKNRAPANRGLAAEATTVLTLTKSSIWCNRQQPPPLFQVDWSNRCNRRPEGCLNYGDKCSIKTKHLRNAISLKTR